MEIVAFTRMRLTPNRTSTVQVVLITNKMLVELKLKVEIKASATY
jgi:hypothetical protein